MKIVQINAVYGEKSTGLIVRDIDLMMQKHNHTSWVVCPQHVPHDNIIKIGNQFDKRLHAVYTRLVGKQGLGSGLETRHLIKWLEKNNPNIIHLHNIHSNFINYRILLDYTAKKSIPVIFTLHDCWLFTGKCYHFLDIGCEKWKTQCKACPKRYCDIPSMLKDSSESIFMLRKELYSSNRLYIVGCSQWITNMAKESPLFSGADIRYIYNGVDTETFSPSKGDKRSELGISENGFVIITMANKWFDSQNSGISQKILAHMKQEDCLIIVGCKETDQKTAEQFKTEGRVLAMARITDRMELAKVYNTGNVFVNLTHIDTLPTVNMEAASCGLPVITYQAGGSGELVAENETGYVIKNFEDDDGILTAIENVRSGRICREACREKALSCFDKDTNYQKYLSLYEEILSLEKK